MGNKLGILLLIVLGLCILYINSQEHPTVYSFNDGPITIASYNMQVFGVSKASNPELMPRYVDLIKRYDIFFIQEIRDESGVAFKELCDMTGYSCAITSRAGSNQTKEQYGIMWNNRSDMVELKDFNLINHTGSFERPPAKVTFQLKRLNMTSNSTTINYYNVSFYVIHTKPDNTPQELSDLEYMVRQDNTHYLAVLGDLNADCSYFAGNIFSDWTQLIKQGTDTTIGSNTCTYDRIIVNPKLDLLVAGSGVDLTTDSLMSDHRPVYFYLN